MFAKAGAATVRELRLAPAPAPWPPDEEIKVHEDGHCDWQMHGVLYLLLVIRRWQPAATMPQRTALAAMAATLTAYKLTGMDKMDITHVYLPIPKFRWVNPGMGLGMDTGYPTASRDDGKMSGGVG